MAEDLNKSEHYMVFSSISINNSLPLFPGLGLQVQGLDIYVICVRRPLYCNDLIFSLRMGNLGNYYISGNLRNKLVFRGVLI